MMHFIVHVSCLEILVVARPSLQQISSVLCKQTAILGRLLLPASFVVEMTQGPLKQK